MKYLVIDIIKLRGFLWKRQTEIARKMGIHPDTLAKKLAGKRSITVNDINGLAKAGSFSVTEFVNFTDVEPK